MPPRLDEMISAANFALRIIMLAAVFAERRAIIAG